MIHHKKGCPFIEKDNIEIITRNGKKLVKKKLQSYTALRGEILFRTVFIEEGFNASKIISIDCEGLAIETEYLGEKTIDLNDLSQYNKSIEVIGDICKTFSVKMNQSRYLKRYIVSLSNNIKMFADVYHLGINWVKMTKYIYKIMQEGRVSLFKDSKPENMIYKKGHIWLIDFEYVMASYYMADLAQFLGYVRTSMQTCSYNMYKAMQLFQNKISGPDIDTELLKLAIVQSHLAGIKRNRSMEERNKVKKTQDAMTLLIELGLVGASNKYVLNQEGIKSEEINA